MRFMMLMIPRIYQGKEGHKAGEDFRPDAEAIETMTKYNEELERAGVLISLDGLHPPVTGAHVTFARGKPEVTDIPSSSRDILGGYWIIRVKSRGEAVEWARRVPARDGDVIEVRQIFEASEFQKGKRGASDSARVNARIEKQKRSA